jgi:hypothetical protein
MSRIAVRLAIGMRESAIMISAPDTASINARNTRYTSQTRSSARISCLHRVMRIATTSANTARIVTISEPGRYCAAISVTASLAE